MLKPGDTFERYTIDSVLGQGGMGTVYRAHDTRLERRVAIKVITEGGRSEEADARLLREARAAAALDHPNAVSIFDVGEVKGAPYVVMEFITGRTLRETTGSAATIEARVGWLGDVARALSAAHKKGLVHRDIKPENVMVRDDGVVKVLDFGIARRSQGGVDPSAPTQATALPTLTKDGAKLGTPAYMAPEQIRSEPVDGRADQFAWGALAFEVLTGKLPWRGAPDPLAVVASILTDEPDAAALDRAGAPAHVKAAVMRALAKKPDERFASMDDVARALEPSARGEAFAGRSDAGRSAPARQDADRSAPARPDAGRGPEVSPAKPGAAGSTLMQRYSTEDVRAVLARAIERQEEEDARGDARLGFEDLLAAAREVGVEEETLREASRELRARAEAAVATKADYEQWRRRKRRKFVRHAGVYAIVSLAFVILGILTGGLIGTIQVPLWWGIGVGIHALRAYTADEDEFHEELEEKARKERKQRRRKEKVDRAIEQAASALLLAGASLRRPARVGPGDQPRLRVAPGDASSQRALAEAAAAEAAAAAAAAEAAEAAAAAAEEEEARAARAPAKRRSK